ncbi:MAG TPA: glutamate-5-semialdehyde dehydrogenase [Deltaproteobacteria bacterium]|nr:glutamate-5-semialdehyde dehydrogenase [Deltaproteobacteria bacterium]HIA57220.1 glutamate-5-semialdehyde dehydrogenase [Candidatus Lambdaproteobacteria bacterium]HIB94752.1 glutamate-5-semialdehyde dehydrogenase [Candidatus Lambdaproteobacteria bacterium]HIN46935.1 glutamate-5-semialdehyde dehydrogenase [Deltaproteobacteria bacterium]HIO83715.1 glutamate-5-semialdehyde dehydrogenase [Deltaproteobacteria bacterium]
MKTPQVSAAIRQQILRAREASLVLANLDNLQKNKILHDLAQALRENTAEILAENARDMTEADKMRERGELSSSACKRVLLNEAKIEQMAKNCESVSALPDPSGKIVQATRLDEGLELYRVSCPIGVILVIFESRPDVVIQISALAIKSGNAVILKGGKEAQNSNRVLSGIIRKTLALSNYAPEDSVSLVESRDEVAELVKMSAELDLIIPRGSNELVQHIQKNAQVPVLGHADGICHVFLDEAADAEKSMEVALDAKLDYPAVCNAVETLLVHQNFPDKWLGELLWKMQEAGVELRVCAETKKRLQTFPELKLKNAAEEDWKTEYIDLIIAVKSVQSAEDAVQHINHFGSKHTDTIVSENAELAEWFMNTVDAAGVFWNASTRFADGFRYGLGAEVGVSTGKIHARGPVGLEGLVIYKYKLYGNGHGVGRYSDGKRDLLHENIAL